MTPPPRALTEALAGAKADFVVRGARPASFPFAFRLFASSVVLALLGLFVLGAALGPVYLGGGATWRIDGEEVRITRGNVALLSPVPQIGLAVLLVFATLAALSFRLAIRPRPWFAGTKDALVVLRGRKVERHPWSSYRGAREPIEGGIGTVLLFPVAQPEGLRDRLRGVGRPLVLTGLSDAEADRAFEACSRRIRDAGTTDK